jgi:hypothetical protein
MTEFELNKKGHLLREQIWRIWRNLDEKILEKFKNINGKTGKYDVPDVLFQKRRSRSNRVLLRWKVLLQNKMTLEHLETFYGGLCVEFVNEDFFEPANRKNDLFNFLVSKLGSDEMISSIVSFRNEDGDSGANNSREYFNLFNSTIKDDFIPIKRKFEQVSGKGDNSGWEGNLFYSIKGGSQESNESHLNINEPMLFNPAVEYANEIVCLDIDLTMSYFALHCYDIDKSTISGFDTLISEIELYLNERVYDEGNLLDYCKNHSSLSWGRGFLVDPIQFKKMSIYDFGTSGLEDSSVVSHNEAANQYKFYFDSRQKFILSPARPTNFFWSKHLSNMMQQNFNLEDYFVEEDVRYVKRKEAQSFLK